MFRIPREISRCEAHSRKVRCQLREGSSFGRSSTSSGAAAIIIPAWTFLDFIGEEKVRDLRLRLFLTVNPRTHAFHSRKQVVAANGHSESEQRGFGVTQRVKLAPQVHGQLVKRLLQSPTLAVQRGHLQARDCARPEGWCNR